MDVSCQVSGLSVQDLGCGMRDKPVCDAIERPGFKFRVSSFTHQVSNFNSSLLSSRCGAKYNAAVKSTNSQPETHLQQRGPSQFVLGIILGSLSAVLYTASNICLRSSVAHDPMWVQTVKELPILLLIGPWLIVRALRGQPVFPPLPVLGVLLFGAVVTHFVGNTLFQWSLGVVGIALGVSILLGSIIVGGAVLARVFLGEIVTVRSAVAIVVLLVAIALLGVAAYQSAPVSNASLSFLERVGLSQWSMVIGVCTTMIAGMAFSTLAVVIRYGVSGKSPVSTTMVVVGFVGVFGLGTLSYLRLGWETLANTHLEDLNVMLTAGICNAVAFLCLTKALQLISVLHVNALGSSQCAMAAVAGVLLFQETGSFLMYAGVLLTVLGLTLMHTQSTQAKSGG
jgi:drug/metabolite transporter (DMT)-like permease